MLTTPKNSIPYPEQGDSPNEATAMANLVGQIDRRMVPRFTTTADRTSRVPSPTEGMVGYHVANHRLEVYRGGAWVPAAFSRTAVKATNTARTLTTTPTDDPELQISGCQSGFTYLLEANIIFTGDTGVDLTHRFGGPTISAGSIYWWNVPPTATLSNVTPMAMGSLGGLVALPSTTIAAGATGSTTRSMSIMRGLFTTSGSGTFTLQWAQSVSSALPTTVLAGSYLQVTMLA